MVTHSVVLATDMTGRLLTAALQGVPETLGILDATLSTLPDWRRVLAGFPVVSWSTFVEYIRTRVNILATEEHLRELVNQLHFLGEVSLLLITALFYSIDLQDFCCWGALIGGEFIGGALIDVVTFSGWRTKGDENFLAFSVSSENDIF